MSVTIRLAAADPEWRAQYEREAGRIRAALGTSALAVEHVGSTSVPNLAAKPILDILVLVPDSRDESAFVPALVDIGFAFERREPHWHEHRLLRGSNPAVNLHVFSVGNPEAARMVLFRDRLCSDESDRNLYESTKRELAQQPWESVQDYADAKSTVVEEILARADPTRDDA